MRKENLPKSKNFIDLTGLPELVSAFFEQYKTSKPTPMENDYVPDVTFNPLDIVFMRELRKRRALNGPLTIEKMGSR